MEVVRKNPAISHQPPSFNGGKIVRPHLASGGSSDSQNKRLTNSIGFQFTDASMLRPMISIAMMPDTIDITPSVPR